MIDWPQISAEVTAGGIVIGGLYTLWMKIDGRFDVLGKQIADSDEKRKMELAAHESKDQERHEEATDKITDIRLVLARAGLNGYGNHRERDT